jgi:hypothetical protein
MGQRRQFPSTTYGDRYNGSAIRYCPCGHCNRNRSAGHEHAGSPDLYGRPTDSNSYLTSATDAYDDPFTGAKSLHREVGQQHD